VNTIINSILVLSGLGILFGVGLAVAAKKLAVESDPRIDEIESLLPGANCGACGFPGCRGLSEAIVLGKVPVSACPVTKDSSPIAQVMGVTVEQEARKVARLRCLGGKNEAVERFIYQGIQDCYSAHTMSGGHKGCEHGCLGLGTCAAACPFGAIAINDNGLPEVDEEKCTGCGICVNSCPRSLFMLGGEKEPISVLCQNISKGAEVRKVCKVGCIGCGLCAKNCPVSAITIKDNLAEINPELCTGCGICVEKCPMKTIRGQICS
jgi:electron transport complex protein RnfB